MKLDAWDWITLGGALLFVAGVALYSYPAALIVAGAGLVRLGVRGNAGWKHHG